MFSDHLVVLACSQERPFYSAIMLHISDSIFQHSYFLINVTDFQYSELPVSDDPIALRKKLHFRAKSSAFASVLRLRACLDSLSRDFFEVSFSNLLVYIRLFRRTTALFDL